jgi:hypothetical protein
MRHFSFLRTQYLRACPTRANSCGMTVSDHSSSTCWYEHVRLLGKYSVSDLISSLADTDSQELELDDVEESVDCASDQISQEVIYDENEAGPSNRENPSPTIETNFQLGDFVIVKFATNKNDRFFIARIDGKNESDSDFTVIALRKKQWKLEATTGIPLCEFLMQRKFVKRHLNAIGLKVWLVVCDLGSNNNKCDC